MNDHREKIAAFENAKILWMYDVTIDSVREVTQKDIQAFVAVSNAYGMLASAMRHALDASVAYQMKNNPYLVRVENGEVKTNAA